LNVVRDGAVIADDIGVTVARDIEAKLEQLIEANEALARENKILREELTLLKRGMFGRRSERLEAGQLDIFGDDAEPPPVKTAELAESKPKKKPGHGRAPFPAHLPREVIELDVADSDRQCKGCGKLMQRIGEDVTERGHIIPARLVVKRYVRPKYACPDGHSIKTADLPDGVIDGGKYEASVYAHVATAKYCDHLPLHRLQGIFKRYGEPIAKQSMWDMLVRVDELVAQPVLEQMRKELLDEDVLHADETPVTMRLEDGKGTKNGYAWGWRNLRRPDEPSRALVEFRTNRGRDGPKQFLGGWGGTLIIDGYPGYDEVIRTNDIQRAGCWAHARRKLKDALDAGSESVAPLLALVQGLFAIERPINERVLAGEITRDEQLELRRAARNAKSRDTVAAIYVEADRLEGLRSTLPKSKLGKALGYLMSQRAALSVFLDDPRLPIHNNDSERDLRHLAVGRKNWLVFGSQRGGEVACRIYSLVLSCKQCGADPEAYIEDVLMKVATTPASEIASLTPWAWQAARTQG
jgi:transposase